MFKKIKDYINKRKQKKIDYWNNLDLDREEKIEKIKKSRSERFMKDSKSLVFQALFCLILLLIIPLYMFITSKVDFKNIHDASAYAEEINLSTVAYEDVVNDSSAIVNFNQVFNFNNTIGNTYTTKANNYFVINGNISNEYWGSIGQSSGFVNGHKYYLFIKQDSNTCRFVIDNSTMRGYSSAIITLSGYVNNAYYYIVCNPGTYTNYNFQVYIIDLTLMFGGNNDNLTLEQCQELFVADYYNYDTGSAVSLSGLNSYSDGVNSVLKDLTYSYGVSYFINNAQTYDRNNGVQSKIYYYFEQGNNQEELVTNGLYFTNGVYVPFNALLSSGTIITLNASLSDYYTHNIGIYSLNNSGASSLLYTGRSLSNRQLVLNYDSVGLIFVDLGSSQLDTNVFFLLNISMSYQDTNLGNLVQQAYDSGFNRASNNYKVGNNGYNQIFEAGRLQGVEDAGNYTFLSLLTSAIDVPINSVLHMLDFDLLGMNMKSFYLSMFTFAIIVFVIKLLI